MDHELRLEPEPEDKEDCFNKVEKALQISVPISLKNILKINSYDNIAVLRHISESDIEEMENFMSSDTALDIIPQNEYEQFYGVFHRNPKKFKFVLGHKKLLFLISKFFQDRFQEENTKSNSEQKTLTERSDDTASTSHFTSESSKEMDRCETKTPNLAPNLSKENLQIAQTVKNWIKSKCTNNIQWQYFKEKFSQISFETKLNIRGELCCIITCFCMGKYQITKSAQKINYSERWVYGNLHRHLTKHFNFYLQSGSTSAEPANGSNKNQSIKKPVQQVGIKKFMTVVRPSTGIQSSPRASPDQHPCERDTVENMARNETPLLLPTENESEPNGVVVEAVTQDKTGSPKINILSNQIVVPAIVYSSANNIAPLEIFSDKEKTIPDIDHEISKDLTCNEKNKWSSIKYQRNMRARRKRENEVINQTVITSFFPLLSTVEKEVENIMAKSIHGDETESVGARLNATIESLPQFSGEPRGEPSADHRSQLLKMLIDISVQNSSNPSSRYHYNDVVKKFSLYLFYTGGRLLYETLYENMKAVLPSISTLNNYVAKTGEKIQEGVFDYDGLCNFLEERNLPKILWISEDGTRVTGKVEYDSKSNKLVGFTLPLVNGLPQTDAFLATSAKKMQDYFFTSSKSNYAYIVMAQPLSKFAPSYCLAVFGTDNKFNSDDVTKRWKHIKENLEKRGITVLGFSSDGDTRLLKTMRQNALLPYQINEEAEDITYEWEWYQTGYKKNDFSNISYVQDTVHIATKLRTRYLNPKTTLTIGSFTASPEHLEQLIANVSKEKHLLTSSDLKGEDKMCFKSAEKLCSESVIQLLECIPGSEGTRAYLRLMQFAIASYLDPALEINERLYKIWFCVFFLRIWRKWITDHRSLKLADNFITSNCYLCIELNAHALINICTNFRENPNLTNDMFLPHLFSSQTCEKIFRATRSMTTTYSTVVNYSIKDIIRRLDRISTINSILHDLQDILIFPREENKAMKGTTLYDLKDLSNDCIQTIVENTLRDALQLTKSLGISVPEKSWNCVSVPLSTPIVEDEENEINFDLDVAEDDSCEIFKMLPSAQCQDENYDPLADSRSEIHIDMCNLCVAGIGQELLLKDFSVKLTTEERNTVFEKGPLVRVTVAPGKSTVIKKSSLCWLLEETTQRISTDRLRRFFNSKSKNSSQSSLVLKRKKLPKNKQTPKKRLCKRSQSQKSILSSESSDEDQILSVKYDDSTDTETFSDGTDKSEKRSVNFCSDYSSNYSTNMTFTTAETSTFRQTLKDTIQPQCGKFYAIYYEQRWYLGLITEIVGDEYVVKFLRKKRKSEREFLWPKPVDISKVSEEFIFYGPIETETDSKEVPLCLSDSQLRQINDIYSQMKKK